MTATSTQQKMSAREALVELDRQRALLELLADKEEGIENEAERQARLARERYVSVQQVDELRPRYRSAVRELNERLVAAAQANAKVDELHRQLGMAAPRFNELGIPSYGGLINQFWTELDSTDSHSKLSIWQREAKKDGCL